MTTSAQTQDGRDAPSRDDARLDSGPAMTSVADDASGPPRARLPRRISPRDIADYRVCPRRVWFRRIAKAPQRDVQSPTLMVGNAVHTALYLFFGLRSGDREPVEERLHQCLRVAWPRHRKPDTFANREEERDYGLQGLKLLSAFAENFDTAAAPLARERWVSTRLPNGVEIFGKVDRVDGEVRTGSRATLDVIDYKTGRKVLENEDLADEPAAQLYLLASEDEYGREVRRVRFLYLASGAEARWEPEREDVEDIRQRLLDVTGQMFKDQSFEARPGEHCAHCAYAHLCPDAGRVELTDLEVDGDELPF